MPHLPTLVAVIVFAGRVLAETPAPVADLVRQLGDPKFAVREAAQKELLTRGEGIVPELDRLAKGADAETAERIGKVRYHLVGYKDDIRRCIVDVKRKRGVFNPIPGELNVPDELRYLIADHQPGSGDLLLAIVADPKKELWYETLHMFVQTWDLMTADQLDRYIRQTVALGTTHRPRFPAGVPAMISFEASFRDGWTAWPNPAPKGFTFRTRTTRYLDGKPYDKPSESSHPLGTVGWYRVGELAEGKHTIHAVMEYEFTQNGQKRKGQLRSKDSSFQVVSADTPDDLIAPKSEARAERVKAALLIRETEPNGPDWHLGGRVVLDGDVDAWAPHVTWDSVAGRAGIHCPVWRVREPVDVDLCFDVVIRDNKTGKTYPADPIVVSRGEQGRGYVIPRDPREFAKDREGFRGVTIELTPSRPLALTYPTVRRYFPDPIVRGELLMKVITPSATVPRRK